MVTYLNKYIETGEFPEIHSWTNIVKKSVYSVANREYKARLLGEESLRGFLTINSEILPNMIWKFTQIYRDQLKYGRTVVLAISLLFCKPYLTKCILCSAQTFSIAEHTLLFCSANDRIRKNLWTSLSSLLSTRQYDMFCAMNCNDQILEMTSGFQMFSFDDNLRVHIFKMVLQHLHYLCKRLTYYLLY